MKQDVKSAKAATARLKAKIKKKPRRSSPYPMMLADPRANRHMGLNMVQFRKNRAKAKVAKQSRKLNRGKR